MGVSELYKCIECIEQYARELHSVNVGYSMSILSTAEKMREIVNGIVAERSDGE